MNNVPLSIKQYASDIKLFEPYAIKKLKLSEHEKEETVKDLLLGLKKHMVSFSHFPDSSFEEKRQLLHAVLNTLPAHVVSASQMPKLNVLLQAELGGKTLTELKNLVKDSTLEIENAKVLVWQGDITLLNADAIVNAANSQMLGCFQPLHACIDNAIHSAAGVQLRDDCEVIMQKQGFLEPTGQAKITRAYNLPSKYVIHTVGPIVQSMVSEQSRRDLANAYQHCLDVCKEMESIRSIAFCGISTGVFGYPAKEAAKVAFATVKEWLQENPDSLDTVVFNVFSDGDKEIYDKIIEEL